MDDLTSGPDAARSWSLAQDVHGFLRATAPSPLAAARHAIAADPSDYRLHYTFGGVLCNSRAIVSRRSSEFRWCLSRRPDDKAVLQRLARLGQHASN